MKIRKSGKNGDFGSFLGHEKGTQRDKHASKTCSKNVTKKRQRTPERRSKKREMRQRGLHLGGGCFSPGEAPTPKEKVHFAPFQHVPILEPRLELFLHLFGTAPALQRPPLEDRIGLKTLRGLMPSGS